MGIMHSLRISASALAAQRLRMDVIANNVANANTTRTPEGGPYQRQSVVFSEAGARAAPFRDILGRARSDAPVDGVVVTGIHRDSAAPRRVFDPTHPDADPDGYVLLPNVDVVTEMTDLVSANRAYQASVTVLNATKSLAQAALGIGRG